MIVAGVDVGSTATKAVILDENRRILARALTDTGANVVRAAENAFHRALESIGLEDWEVGYTVGTGYGRYKVPFGNAQITEITCHARGASALFPGTRTILDIGGQDTKAIRINDHGEVLDFCMNDKCAAGTGRFLSAAADVLEMPLDAIGPASLRARALDQGLKSTSRARGRLPPRRAESQSNRVRRCLDTCANPVRPLCCTQSDAFRPISLLVWLLARGQRGVRAQPSLLKAESRKQEPLVAAAPGGFSLCGSFRPQTPQIPAPLKPMLETKDLRIVDTTLLKSPNDVSSELPLSERAASVVFEARQEIQAVLHGDDTRPLAIEDNAPMKNAGRNIEGRGHLDNRIRRAVLELMPAVGKGRQGWRDGIAALRRARIDPRDDRRNLRVGQTAVIGELMTESGICEPWGHLVIRDPRFDGARPWSRVLKGDQRHRRDLAWPVTGHTPAVENRRDITIEGRRRAHDDRGTRDRDEDCTEQGSRTEAADRTQRLSRWNVEVLHGQHPRVPGRNERRDQLSAATDRGERVGIHREISGAV
jgi:hypothetical protein